MASFLSDLYDLFQAVRGANPSFLQAQPVPGTDLRGKWIIISGSNNGVGFEAAKSFAAWGANLVLACREPPAWELHPTAAVEQCKDHAETQGNGSHSSTIEWWEIDMADLSSVEAFCRRWLKSGRVLDILCNNAGVALPSSTMPGTPRTKDGFGLIHQVNFLSHVLLTLRLLPSLACSPEPRIICTTSCIHHLGVFDLDHFDYTPSPSPGPGARPEMKGNDYPNNKLYFQMWVAELQARLLKHPEYLHITVNGVNPGFVASGLWIPVQGEGEGESEGEGEGDDVLGRILGLLLRYFAISPQQGSVAITHAATSAELGPDPTRQNVGAPGGRGGGKYINRVWEAAPKVFCNDPDARSRLWIKLDEELHLREKGLLGVLGL